MFQDKIEGNIGVEEEPADTGEEQTGVEKEEIEHMLLLLLPAQCDKLIRDLSLDITIKDSSHYDVRKRRIEEIISLMEQKEDGLKTLRQAIDSVTPEIEKY